MIRLIKPTCGNILFNGKNIAHIPDEEMQENAKRNPDHFPGSIWLTESASYNWAGDQRADENSQYIANRKTTQRKNNGPAAKK